MTSLRFGNSLLWHSFALTSLCCDIPLLWHPFCCDTPALWHPFAVEPSCFDIPLLWHPFAVAFLCCDIPLPWHPFAVAFLCCDVPLLWHPVALTSHFFHIPMLWHPFALTSHCFGIPMLWHPFALTLRCCDIPKIRNTEVRLWNFRCHNAPGVFLEGALNILSPGQSLAGSELGFFTRPHSFPGKIHHPPQKHPERRNLHFVRPLKKT